MSNPLKENQNGAGEAVYPTEDMSSAGSSAATIPATTADDQAVVELEEGHTTSTPVGNGSVINRYRQILQEQRDQLSEDGSSVGDAPRRAGSPISSTLSVPDDAVSVQVWQFGPRKLRSVLTYT